MEENNVNEVTNNVNTENVKENLGAPKKHSNKVMKKKFNILKLLKNKIFLLGVLALIVIITIIVIVVNILNATKYDKYYKYEDMMNVYGFNRLYDNESAATEETVTKIEAIRVVLGVALNTTDITEYLPDSNLFPESTWATYGEKSEITKYSPIDASNYKEQISYIDVISYFNGAKNRFFKDIVNGELDKDIGDINEYNLDQQIAIKVLVANDILVEAINDINGNDMIFKGQLNELAVNFANEFNTLVYSEDSNVNINPENLPENHEDYPYTLANVDKSIYEMPFETWDTIRFLTPTQMYAYNRTYLRQMSTISKDYLELILNIDYKTITIENFTEQINSFLVYDEEPEYIEEYINYVKENEIVITGTATPIEPAVYYDGRYYKVRTRIDFKIESSKTNEDLIYYDLFNGLVKTYEKTEYSIYVDYTLTDAMNSEAKFIKVSNIYSTLVDKVNSGITEEIFVPDEYIPDQGFGGV